MMADAKILTQVAVVPEVPTLGLFGQHFNRSAVLPNMPGGYGEDIHYFMISPQQPLTVPNIDMTGFPPHQSWQGFPAIPTSDASYSSN